MSGHLDGPPPGPPDPPYIPGDLGAPSAKEFARRRASPTPEERNPYAPSADWKPGQDTFTSQAAGIWAEGFAAGRAAATPDPPDAESLARMFHDSYEALAPSFGYITREASAVAWENVPADNKALMISTARAVLRKLSLRPASPDERLREVNDLRDQVQMYEEKAERDWRDFGEMQDARIAADDRVVELEKELARVCKQLDSANDMVERAWSLIAGAMSGNPHKPTANSEWMDAAHAWEIDYCMGGSPGWLAYERGRAAADSWWRSRLVSDETVEAVAQTESFRGGPCLCSRCNDERADVRHLLERVLAALLPVNEPETCRKKETSE